MDFGNLGGDAVIAILTLAGTWGVIRSQVADLRQRVQAIDDSIRGRDGMESRVTRLERDQESHSKSLDEAVRKLEKVTADLQTLMMDFARGGRA